MSGSDSRLPAAQSLTAPPFPDPPFPAVTGPAGRAGGCPGGMGCGVQVEIVIPVRNEEDLHALISAGGYRY